MNRKYVENLVGIAKRRARIEAENAEKNFSKKFREGYSRDHDYTSDAEHLKRTHDEYERVSDATHKARMQAGGVGLGALGIGGYGVHKMRQKQISRDAETLNDIYKQAEHMPNLCRLLGLKKQAFFGEAMEGIGSGLARIGKSLKGVGNSAMNLTNTAGGGKIRTFAEKDLGYKPGSTEHKNFLGMSPMGQMRHVLKTTGDKSKVNSLIQLHKDKGSAQLGLGTAGALGVGLAASKMRNSNNSNNSPVYYG